MKTLIDYEGNTVGIGSRIELHPACDLWMRGARYGTIAKVADDNGTPVAVVRMDHPQVRKLQRIPAELLRAMR